MTAWATQPFLASGTGHPRLRDAVASELDVAVRHARIESFPDGELHVELVESARGEDVFLVQPTAHPVERNLLELVLLADAARRAGARRITAVVPYFGYARQDRRSTGREAVGARVVLDLLASARFDRIVTVDAHTQALEGFSSVPLEIVTAEDVLVRALGRLDPRTVVVAPDLGAAKLAERFAGALGLSAAFVHKKRHGAESVRVTDVEGDVAGRPIVIVDDMISTGVTIEAAAAALSARGAEPSMTVVATHGLFVSGASERLRPLPITRCLVTDTVARAATCAMRPEIVTVAPLLAETIRSLHRDHSLAPLLAHH